MTHTMQATTEPKRGRGFGHFRKGEHVTEFAQVSIGTVLLEYSAQFDAENTVKVTDMFNSRIYVRFVNPEHPEEFWGPPFCVWDFELNLSTELWIAER